MTAKPHRAPAGGAKETEPVREEIARVLVVGSGTMGGQIAFQCAAHGLEVHLYDRDERVLESAMERIRSYAADLVSGGELQQSDVETALTRITVFAEPAAAARGVDLVTESIPEDPSLKGSVFAEFHHLCPERAIFTTNTSTLSPSRFARQTGRSDRFLALHFHPPVWTSNVADVMPHARTNPAVTETVVTFARRIGQIPIRLKKESGSYVFNKMLNALLGAAVGIAADGIAEYRDVDRAWMGIMKTGIGPFGIIDLVGIDVVHHITDYWARKLFFIPRLKRNARYLKPFVDAGMYGRKTGKGFYSYPDPEYAHADFIGSTDR